MPRKYFSFLSLLALCALSGTVLSATADKAKDERVVKDGMLVSLNFTVKSADGTVIETTKGGEPARYIHGKKMIPPGLEKELTGMKVGDEKHVTVADAYGKINPKALQEFPREKIPENALKVGATLAAKSPEGRVMPMTVREIKEKTVVMDLNHPMAGKTLVFDVKVVDIQPAPLPPQAQPARPSAPANPVVPTAPAKSAEPAKK